MKTTSMIAGAAFCLAAAAPLQASEWEDIKDPASLRALYSNKTFKGKDYLERPFVGHYRADGQGALIWQGTRVPRSWTVKRDDQVCVNTSMNTSCFRLQRHSAKPGVYRSINVANDMATEFTVEDGVPQF